MRSFAWAALMAAACQRGPTGAGPSWGVPLSAPASATDAVVATVDGRPIRASEVALQARAAGEDARAALTALVDAEVLAGEAARRGLDANGEVRQACRATAVQRLLASSFEKEVTPDKIPAPAVSHVYEQNRRRLNHEQMIDVWHILVPVDKSFTQADRAAARAAAEDLARRARGVGSAEAFKALVSTVKAPRPAKAESVVTERDGWTVKEFSYPAFEHLKKPGDTSPVIETSYGYHVMFLNGFHPPEHVSLEAADPKLRAGMFPDFQRREFIRFVERAAGSHEVTEHPERLPRSQPE
jgi:peptidyl-prolyl cis-trans isomerase C